MAVIRDNIITYLGSVQHKRGLSDTLNESDYVPLEGELLVATDTGEIRVGDGTHAWVNLPRFDALEGITGFDYGEITVSENNGG